MRQPSTRMRRTASEKRARTSAKTADPPRRAWVQHWHVQHPRVHAAHPGGHAAHQKSDAAHRARNCQAIVRISPRIRMFDARIRRFGARNCPRNARIRTLWARIRGFARAGGCERATVLRPVRLPSHNRGHPVGRRVSVHKRHAIATRRLASEACHVQCARQAPRRGCGA